MIQVRLLQVRLLFLNVLRQLLVLSDLFIQRRLGLGRLGLVHGLRDDLHLVDLVKLFVGGLLQLLHPVARLQRPLLEQLVLALHAPEVALELLALLVVAVGGRLLMLELRQRPVLDHLLLHRLVRQRQLVLQLQHPHAEHGGVLLALQLRVFLLVRLHLAVGLAQLPLGVRAAQRLLLAPAIAPLLLQRELERLAHLVQLGLEECVL